MSHRIRCFFDKNEIDGKLIIKPCKNIPSTPKGTNIIIYNNDGTLKIKDYTSKITQLFPLASGAGDVFSLNNNSTENTIVKMCGTTGKCIQQASGVTIDNTNTIKITGSCLSNYFDTRNSTILHIYH